MAFTLRVNFSGVGGYVFDQAPNPQKMMVVLVNAAKEGSAENKRAIDRSPLRRHRAFVRIQRKNLAASGLPGESELVWYIRNRRVTFQSDESDPFRVVGPDGASAPSQNLLPLGPGSLLPTMEEIFTDSKFAEIDPQAVSSQPPQGLVVAQVVVDQGQAGSPTDPKKPDDTRWTYRPAFKDFTKQVTSRLLARRFAVDIAFDQKITLLATPFSQNQPNEPIDLSPAPGEDHVEITVANLCAENPLEWEGEEIGTFPDRTLRDPDFNWSYELCRHRATLRKKINDLSKLAGQRLRLPTPVALQGNVGTNPAVCYRPLFQPTAF